MKEFELYLDESGSFQDNSADNPSLVGGILYNKSSIDQIIKKLPGNIHASENYDKAYLQILQEIKSLGGKFVIFENKERLLIINGDITYLNIISEGIVKVLLELAEIHNNEAISINIIIASRLKVSSSSQKNNADLVETIPESDYKTRLEEKLFLSLGKSKIKNIQYFISLASARKSKHLMLADIICNTYYTRTAKKKFTDVERLQIENLYADALIYPVFDSAIAGYLRKLFIEKRYGEMLCQICTLPKLSGVASLRKKLLNIISALPYRERNVVLSSVSAQISQYNYTRHFPEGITFSLNYIKHILIPLRELVSSPSDETSKNKDLLNAIDFWTFDTDFFLLTMYDHMGNLAKCNEYIKRCKENIHSINNSWEHIDYYFKYKLREMNCLLGQFDFETVIENDEKLITVFKNAKELFDLVGAYDETGVTPPSELLGKAYGIKLEAYINLLPIHPELEEQAITASDCALAEFTEQSDLRRQWQYRSQLMILLDNIDEAKNCLLKSVGISSDESNPFSVFVDTTCNKANNIDSFSLMHYTNLLQASIKKKSSLISNMATALLDSALFNQIVQEHKYEGHPWQLIFWNIGKYYRDTGYKEKYQLWYKKAMEIVSQDPTQATMFSFALNMSADNLLYCMKHLPKQVHAAENEYKQLNAKFHKNEIPDSMRKRFPVYAPDEISETQLRTIAISYLR